LRSKSNVFVLSLFVYICEEKQAEISAENKAHSILNQLRRLFSCQIKGFLNIVSGLSFRNISSSPSLRIHTVYNKFFYLKNNFEAIRKSLTYKKDIQAVEFVAFE